MTIVIIIALLLGGGTSFAAENALPGDILYSVKVNINEKVQEMAAISAQSEAEVQANIATRRLSEMEKLASENRLSTSTAMELKAEFKDHSGKSKMKIEEIAKKDGEKEAAKISSDIEASLLAHKDILNGLRDGVHAENGIFKDISENLNFLATIRINGDTTSTKSNGADVKTMAEGAQISAQNKLEEVKKHIELKQATLSAEAQANIDEHLKVADEAMTEGTVKINAGAYADAFSLFKKAAREAQTAKMYSNISIGLRLDFGNDGYATGTVKRQDNGSETLDDSQKNEVRGSVEINVNGGIGDINTDLKIKTEQEANGEGLSDDDASLQSNTEVETGIKIKL